MHEIGDFVRIITDKVMFDHYKGKLCKIIGTHMFNWGLHYKVIGYIKNREIQGYFSADELEPVDRSTIPKAHVYIAWDGKPKSTKAKCIRCGVIRDVIDGKSVYTFDGRIIDKPGCLI